MKRFTCFVGMVCMGASLHAWGFDLGFLKKSVGDVFSSVKKAASESAGAITKSGREMVQTASAAAKQSSASMQASMGGVVESSTKAFHGARTQLEGAVRKSVSSAQSEMNARVAKMKSTVDAGKKSLVSTRERLEKRQKAFASSFETMTKEQRASFEKKMDGLRSVAARKQQQFDEKMKEQQAMLQTHVAQSEAALARKRQELERSVGEKSVQLKKEIAQRQKDLDAQREELEASFVQRQKQLEGAVASQERRTRALQAEMAKSVGEKRNAFEKQLAAEQASLNDAMKRQEKGLSEGVHRMQSKVSETQEKLESAQGAQKIALEKQLAQYRLQAKQKMAELDEVSQKQSALFEERARIEQERIVQLQKEAQEGAGKQTKALEQEIAKRQKALDAMTSAQEKRLQGAIAASKQRVAQTEKEMKGATGKRKEELQAALAQRQKELAEKTSALERMSETTSKQLTRSVDGHIAAASVATVAAAGAATTLVGSVKATGDRAFDEGVAQKVESLKKQQEEQVSMYQEMLASEHNPDEKARLEKYVQKLKEQQQGEMQNLETKIAAQREDFLAKKDAVEKAAQAKADEVARQQKEEEFLTYSLVQKYAYYEGLVPGAYKALSALLSENLSPIDRSSNAEVLADPADNMELYWELVDKIMKAPPKGFAQKVAKLRVLLFVMFDQKAHKGLRDHLVKVKALSYDKKVDAILSLLTRRVLTFDELTESNKRAYVAAYDALRAFEKQELESVGASARETIEELFATRDAYWNGGAVSSDGVVEVKDGGEPKRTAPPEEVRFATQSDLVKAAAAQQKKEPAAVKAAEVVAPPAEKKVTDSKGTIDKNALQQRMQAWKKS